MTCTLQNDHNYNVLYHHNSIYNGIFWISGYPAAVGKGAGQPKEAKACMQHEKTHLK